MFYGLTLPLVLVLRFALAIAFYDTVSAPVLSIVASPDSVWFFHIQSELS